jgi:transcription elongation factor Elf1
LDRALELLDGDKQDDPEGVMANCAGNLLVRSGRFEDADEKYRGALAVAPDNVEYLCNRASCLIEQGLFGEADGLLARAHGVSPSPAILEMISYVAAKKGEYQRAEQACRSALEMDPLHAPSLLSLGWVLLTQGRRDEVRELIRRLDRMDIKQDALKGRDELASRLDDQLFSTVECASCERSWKIPKDPPPTPSIRLAAMPPDDLPAGSCLFCGKTYCIGCAKKNVNSSGRFTCPSCNQPLKLVNDGLKNLVYDWAAKNGFVENNETARTEVQGNASAEAPAKRGRGRPRKKPS